LHLLVGHLRELKGLLDLLELTHPNDPRKMFGGAHMKATQRSVFNTHPRTAATERPAVNNAQKKTACKFLAEGSCEHGKACKFDHGSGQKGRTTAKATAKAEARVEGRSCATRGRVSTVAR
jgi:hypothetical protein